MPNQIHFFKMSDTYAFVFQGILLSLVDKSEKFYAQLDFSPLFLDRIFLKSRWERPRMWTDKTREKSELKS